MQKFPNLPNGDYHGKGRSRGENETDALQLVHPSISRKEPMLYQSKWWDYRLMHHIEATRYWAWCYTQAARKWVATTGDVALSATVVAFDGKDPLKTRDATSVIAARQAMDSIGCRYPWAFEWTIQRFSDRGWRTFPRPNQLYGEEYLLDMKDAWETEVRARVQRPEALVFRTPGHEGLRTPCRAWLVETATFRTPSLVRWMPLSTLCREGYLDAGDLWRALPKSMAERALSSIK